MSLCIESHGGVRMGIESMNRVSSSYQEQGSSVKTASVQAAPQVEAPEPKCSVPSRDMVV